MKNLPSIEDEVIKKQRREHKAKFKNPEKFYVSQIEKPFNQNKSLFDFENQTKLFEFNGSGF